MSKVKCLFGKHDLYFSNEDDYCYRCRSCTLLIRIFDGVNPLSDFTLEYGDDVYTVPYFHTAPDECVMACNMKLTEEEVLSIYKWTEEYWKKEGGRIEQETKGC